MSSRSSKGYAGLIVLGILLVVLVAGWSQSQRIGDWLRLRGYAPTAEITAIAEQTTMSSQGKHLFFINRPALEDKATFRQNCPDYEATIVIGCYRQGQGGIHVLKVDDPRLEGVEQVTAAHEMLHAAYDRLKQAERQQIESWLLDYAQNGLIDVRVKDTLKSYETTEPGQQANEMYAIFGTEIANLPADLERHYQRYFNDRSAVVRFASNYQEAFTSRQKQVDAYDKQLNNLNAQIKANTEALAKRRDDLAAVERQLNGYRQSGDIGRYNAGVEDYNAQVNAYNALLEQTRGLINEHNRIVVVRNDIAAQTVELRQAIDSDALPQNR